MYSETNRSCMIHSMSVGDIFTVWGQYFEVIKIGDINYNSIVYNLTTGKLMSMLSFKIGTVCKLVD